MTQQLILKLGDCVERMQEMEEGSIGAIVCDPPYGLSFMGKDWDTLDAPPDDDPENVSDRQGMLNWHVRWLKQAYRVLQPGGVIKAFSATRTYHQMALAMRHAGFVDLSLEAWGYGSGFPKSLNVSKAVDSLLGNDREVVRTESKADSTYHTQNVGERVVSSSEYEVTKAVSSEAAQWEGWGTALKPAWEPFVVGRKPDASV
jgi:hypothetical protein